jgi:hypothetical protein
MTPCPLCDEEHPLSMMDHHFAFRHCKGSQCFCGALMVFYVSGQNSLRAHWEARGGVLRHLHDYLHGASTTLTQEMED